MINIKKIYQTYKIMINRIDLLEQRKNKVLENICNIEKDVLFQSKVEKNKLKLK